MFGVTRTSFENGRTGAGPDEWLGQPRSEQTSSNVGLLRASPEAKTVIFFHAVQNVPHYFALQKARRPMGKKSKKPDKADQKYLTTGLLLSAGGLGLALLTYVIWLFGGIEAFAYRILLLVPIGAVVLLLIGGGSILKWMFGDKIDWD
jgi:hypothetical protein